MSTPVYINYSDDKITNVKSMLSLNFIYANVFSSFYNSRAIYFFKGFLYFTKENRKVLTVIYLHTNFEVRINL